MSNARNLANLLNTDTTIATADVANGGITTAKLADDAVTSAKLDTNIAIGGTLGVTGALTANAGINFTGDTAINNTVDTAYNIRSSSGTGQHYFGANRTGFSGGVDIARLGSTGTVFNESGADLDFRVESDELTHCLFVDASANAVGIGTDSPTERLVLANSSNLIKFGLDSTSHDIFSNGKTFNIGTTDGTVMRLFTNNNERLRIDDSGRVGIGTTSIAEPLRVQADSDTDFSASGAVFNSAIMLKNSTAGANNCVSLAMSTESNGEVYLSTVQNSSNNAADFVISTRASGARAERMRIDSSGRVGIGASNNGDYHANNDDLLISTSGSTGITIASGTSDQGRIAFADGTGSDDEVRGLIMYNHNGNAMTFHTNAGTAMYILYTGNVGIGTDQNAHGLSIFRHLQSYGGLMIQNGTNNTGQIFQAFHRSNGSVVGSISHSGGGNNVTFNTSSDYRLKQNVSYTWDATTRLKQLKPARFSWIDDNTNTLEDGFLAHEVSSIVPEAIIGAKDGTQDIGTVKDADGNIIEINLSEIKFTERKKETLDLEGNTVDAVYPSNYTWTKTNTENVYQTIDHSKLVSLLVKTIQELEVRITVLESA